MTNKEELIKTITQQVDLLSSKQRFGYFSIPPSLSIGDAPIQQRRNIDENGKVVTKPRNIYTKPTQTGNMKSSYFRLEKSIFDGDLFMDPGKNQSMNNLRKSQTFASKEKFKPLNSIQKTLLSSSYVHIDQNPIQKNLRQRRDQDGRVITNPRNVQSSPQTKITQSLYKHPQYMETPYDNEKVLRAKQHEQNKKKMQQRPFKNTCFQREYFSTPKQSFGLDKQFPQKALKKKDVNLQSQDVKFKPSGPCKSGALGFIGKFPEHMADPPTEITRKAEEQKNSAFKLCAPNKIVTPCPSISFSVSNLRKYVR